MVAVGNPPKLDARTVRSLIRETLWIRDLHDQCIRRGIPVGYLSTLVRSAKALVEYGRLESAGHRLREVKMDLLAELLLAEEVPAEDVGPFAPSVLASGPMAYRPSWPPSSGPASVDEGPWPSGP